MLVESPRGKRFSIVESGSRMAYGIGISIGKQMVFVQWGVVSHLSPPGGRTGARVGTVLPGRRKAPLLHPRSTTTLHFVAVALPLSLSLTVSLCARSSSSSSSFRVPFWIRVVFCLVACATWRFSSPAVLLVADVR
jgi:hypothetical protein